MKENLDPNWLGNEEDEIYRENILDHYKNPRNFGEIKNANVMHSEFNPFCGDMVKIFLKFDNEKVVDVKFKGNGCAISMAATSMLTERLIGKSLSEIKKITNKDIFEMLGIELGIVRMKCGLLCLNALYNGLKTLEDKNGTKS